MTTLITLNTIAQTFLNNTGLDLLKGKFKEPKLLTGNTKLEKGKAITLGLALLPADSLNYYLKDEHKQITVCPSAVNHSCDKICIGLHSGHYSMKQGSAHKAQLKRSLMFHFNKKAFELQLKAELCSIAAFAMAKGETAYIRLNVFSDLQKWSNQFIKDFKKEFAILAPYISFYDYTKIHTSKLVQGYTVALSVSKASLGGKLRKAYQEALNNFEFSSIVVSKEDKAETIKSLSSILGVHAIDGDLRDNFPTYKKYIGHKVLVLSAKGASHRKKDETKDIFAISKEEAYQLYYSTFERPLIPLKNIA